MRKHFLTFLIVSVAAALTSSAQQAKPNTPHVDVTTVHITYPGFSPSTPGIVVWADQATDKFWLAKPEGNGWVIKDLPLGSYGFYASSISSKVAGGNQDFQVPILVKDTTKNVQLYKMPSITTLWGNNGYFAAYVQNVMGEPLSGVTVSFVITRKIEGKEAEIKTTCNTYVNGICIAKAQERMQPGTVNLTVSIPDQAPQSFPNITTKSEILAKFTQLTAAEIKQMEKSKQLNVK